MLETSPGFEAEIRQEVEEVAYLKASLTTRWPGLTGRPSLSLALWPGLSLALWPGPTTGLRSGGLA